MRSRSAGHFALAALCSAQVAGLGLAPAAAQAQEPSCVGDIDAVDVQQKPGPRLRFGIGPLVQAGQIGPAPGPAVPEQPARTHSFLAALRPRNGAFVLRLNRFFWSDGEEGFRRYLGLAERFTQAGYLIELQVRYHPSAAQEGDIPAWTRHVREVVRRFGANPRVIALQIANEVNLTFSEDSSDGAYEGARAALVQGVDRRQGRGAQTRARPSGHRLQLGLPHRSRLRGELLALAARPRRADVRGAHSTGLGWTPTPAPCSRPWRARAASATAW